MNNILLVGFYGEGNLGDEAILQAICQNLPENVNPIITSGVKQNFGVSIRRRGLLSWPSFLMAASKSPITVFSGGILQDWSWEGVTFFAYRIITAAKMGSAPVLFGAGIGPIRSEKARRLVKKALSFVKLAYVRDKSSYDLYKSLLPEANVYLGTDWTWHFDINKQKSTAEPKLAVNIRQWGNEQLLSESFDIVKAFDGAKVGLAARKGDGKLIKDAIGLEDVSCPESFVSFAEACKGCSHGVAMRYHAALAMIRAGLATKLICYDDKVKDLAFSAGMSLNKNGISSHFNAPSCDFFAANDKLYQNMKKEFLNLLNSIYSFDA